MDLFAKFEELKTLKKNNETLEELKTLLSMSKKDNDIALALEILLYLVETMRYLRQHQEAIDALETEISSEFFSKKEDRLIVIDELIKILLRTEDFIKLESVLFNRERFLTNEHQKVMQKFYYAVCYEGMEEYKKAISSLKSIKDTISASNLVSKYLKLSMLYLKENDVSLARQNFNHAIKFDYQKKNPIFHLAESDILYHEQDYHNSLVKYQEYFIKSKNKKRYLDRYILINIKLNKLDEAWRFYQEYLSSMKTVLSKNYRLIFYQASLKLAELLNNKLEIDKLNYLINELEPEAPILNRFDSVYRLLSIAFNDKKFSKERDIVLNLFKAIDSLYKFQKMIYVLPKENSVEVYHYSKGLLLEKEINVLNLTDTILERVIDHKSLNDLYTYDDIINYSRSIYKTVETKYIFANSINRELVTGYFVVYSKDIDNFDFQQKLILLATEILKKQLNDFDNNSLNYEMLDSYSKLIDLTELGLIKIDNNIIHFLNNNAKNIIGLSSDYLAFEEFQKLLADNLFIDDFLYSNRLTIKLKQDDNIKEVEAYIVKGEFTIFALIKASKEFKLDTKVTQLIDIKNIEQMLKDNQTITSKTLILFDIRNYIDFLKDYDYLNYQKILYKLIEELKITSKNHLDDIYLESFNLIYLVLNTIDKRVIKRISEQIIRDFNEYDLRIGVIQANHSLSYEKIIQLRYLDSLTDNANRIIFDNKNFRYNQELSKTILININSLIKSNFVPLEYHCVSNWKNQEDKIYKIEVSSKAMLGDKSSLKRVIKSAKLSTEWDNLVINSLVHEIKKNNINREYVLELSWETVSDRKSLNKAIRKASDNNIKFLLDFSEISDVDQYRESLSYIKEKAIDLIAINFIDKVNIDFVSIFNEFNYLIYNVIESKRKELHLFHKILENYQITFIYNHGKETLRKSELEALNISYVYGDAYPKYDDITLL